MAVSWKMKCIKLFIIGLLLTLAAVAADESLSCAFYHASFTQSALNGNSVLCTFNLCGAHTIQVSTCDNCFGDSFLRLYNPSNRLILASGDDGCSASYGCSKLTYQQASGCAIYGIAQGCFAGTACSGTTTITIIDNTTSVPSRAPTRRPSAVPTTTSIPTAAPSAVPTLTMSPSVGPTPRPSRRPSTLTPTTSAQLPVLAVNKTLSCAGGCKFRVCQPVQVAVSSCAGCESLQLSPLSDGITEKSSSNGDLSYRYESSMCIVLVLQSNCSCALTITGRALSSATVSTSQTTTANNTATAHLAVIVVFSILGLGLLVGGVYICRRKSIIHPFIPSAAPYGVPEDIVFADAAIALTPRPKPSTLPMAQQVACEMVPVTAILVTSDNGVAMSMAAVDLDEEAGTGAEAVAAAGPAGSRRGRRTLAWTNGIDV